MFKKKIAVLLLPLALLASLFTAAPVQAADDFSVAANAGYAIDAESGKILFDQNGETAVGIASVTKTLSTYLVLKAIDENKITWETTVPISDYAHNLSMDTTLSNVPLTTTDTYTVKDLYQAMLIESANACTVALAELIAGSEPNFVNQMRTQLTDWGIDDATIYTASGLNNSDLGDNRYPDSPADAENLMSAKDVAIIAQHLINDYPEVLDTTSVTSMTFGANTSNPTEMTNWNWLLPGNESYKEGVDGLKTGTTELAGACFVGTIKKDGRRVITVILNATNQATNSSARFAETSSLMDYCYDNWSQRTVKASTMTLDTSDTTLSVSDGQSDSVGLKIKGSAKVWVRNDMDLSNLTATANVDSSLLNSGSLVAPVTKNEKVGTASVTLSEDTLGYLDKDEAPTVNLVAKSAVDRANILTRLWRQVTSLF